MYRRYTQTCSYIHWCRLSHKNNPICMSRHIMPIYLWLYKTRQVPNDCHRPVLVKLTHSCDVSNILANLDKLSNLPGISIKPQMSPKERNTESILLRERYILINSGTSKSDIKIRRNALYINNTKYDSATDSIFTLCSSPSNTTQASPVAPCNTSTNAASHEDVTETHPPIYSFHPECPHLATMTTTPKHKLN